jgi:hypothetical protein
MEGPKVLFEASFDVRRATRDGRYVRVRVYNNYKIRSEKLPADKFVRVVLLDELYAAEEQELMQEQVNDVRSIPTQELERRALDEYHRLFKVDDPRVIDTTLKAA